MQWNYTHIPAGTSQARQQITLKTDGMHNYNYYNVCQILCMLHAMVVQGTRQWSWVIDYDEKIIFNLAQIGRGRAREGEEGGESRKVNRNTL